MTGFLTVLFWVFVVFLLLGALDNMVSRGERIYRVSNRRRVRRDWWR